MTKKRDETRGDTDGTIILFRYPLKITRFGTHVGSKSCYGLVRVTKFKHYACTDGGLVIRATKLKTINI